jgi:hypothetical protein
MYLSIVKYTSREINSKLTHIFSMYNHIDYSSDERHDYCIFDACGNVRWEMVRVVLRSLTGFLRGEGPGHSLRHARQSSLGLRFLSYPMWIVIVTRR